MNILSMPSTIVAIILFIIIVSITIPIIIKSGNKLKNL